MEWTGTLVDDLARLGGIPEDREEELLYGMFVLNLSVDDAVAYIRADIPIVSYVSVCDRSWTIEQVADAWKAGIPAEYVSALGRSSEKAS